MSVLHIVIHYDNFVVCSGGFNGSSGGLNRVDAIV